MTVDEFDFPGEFEQRDNIARVHNRIAPIISQFFHERGVGSQFHVDELRRYVQLRCPINAPDSAGRIMRDMRERKWIGYEVVNRRKSLYRIVPTKEG